LFSASRAVVGLVWVTAWRAEWIRWVGSLMKCFAGRLVRGLFGS
jgi:hypothetical protein